VEVVAVDASARALEFARKNIEKTGARFESLQGDVLKDLVGLASDSFDVVISDPPALVKGRKDLGPGTHAYLQLNTQAIRLVKRGGWITCCSCSALLPDEDFAKAITKAAMRNQKAIAWVARGGPGSDHPVRLEFPEGRYLKAWIGRVDAT
jgi:23S rRNA (cytosine1962-C5)-methyltransferase